jgi:hypothetical protein
MPTCRMLIVIQGESCVWWSGSTQTERLMFLHLEFAGCGNADIGPLSANVTQLPTQRIPSLDQPIGGASLGLEAKSCSA